MKRLTVTLSILAAVFVFSSYIVNEEGKSNAIKSFVPASEEELFEVTYTLVDRNGDPYTGYANLYYYARETSTNEIYWLDYYFNAFFLPEGTYSIVGEHPYGWGGAYLKDGPVTITEDTEVELTIWSE